MIQDAYSSLCGLFLTHYQERLWQDWARLGKSQTKLYPQDHPDPEGADSDSSLREAEARSSRCNSRPVL